MRVRHGLEHLEPLRGCAVALGNFDGVHRGHQELIRVAAARAREKRCPVVVLTFDPHPEMVLHPQDPPGLLTTKEQKIELMASLGVDYLCFLPFNMELASLSPEGFVEGILWGHFHPRIVVVGFNFTFGKGGRGNPSVLAALGQELGFEVEIIPPVKVGNQLVSSTAVREALARGDVEEARELLGYWPTLIGEVVSGQGRGRLLGFPTANVAVPAEVRLPAFGVYACRVKSHSFLMPGIVNIGQRPTFGVNLTPTVEVHLFDFSGDLYGEKLRVELRHFLRPERRFAGPDDLRRQILEDISKARELLGDVTSSY